MRLRAGILVPSLFLLLAAIAGPGIAQEQPESAPDDTAAGSLRVTIADAFIELHTGPGSAYPITYVIDRDTEVTIVRRVTSWFKIQTDNGKSGWASRSQMQQTLLPDGKRFELTEFSEADFARRKWVLGMTGGELEASPIFTLFGAYSFSENLAAELHLGRSVGDVSSSTLLKANLVMQPLPDLKYSPYMTLGIGRIQIDPSATLVLPGNGTNTFSQFGLGLQRYISHRFLLRFEINEYIIFSPSDTSDNNEEVSEWKVGFAVFF